MTGDRKINDYNIIDNCLLFNRQWQLLVMGIFNMNIRFTFRERYIPVLLLFREDNL